MTNKEAIEILKKATLFIPSIENRDYPKAFDMAIKALEEQERPTGEWIFDGVCFSSFKFKCSICHYPELEKTNYCPTCGARMEA